MGDLRSQLKATPIKLLKKAAEKDNEMVGATSSEYLQLVDGKSLKIRIFPAHPGVENFYISKKSYWLSIANKDGEIKRGTVLDSRIHGGTSMDIVDEYVKMAKRIHAGDEEKLEALIGTGQNSDSLNPSFSWLCYASVVTPDEDLKPMLWEFKKMVRDQINKLSFSEDDDDAIETDPFTDVDEGLPILVKYNKKPNKKAGENYYEVSFPKKQIPRSLSDEEIERFMSLKPLSEILASYDIKMFERALEGLQNFDEDHDMGLFENDEWIEKIEEVKSQYQSEEEDKPVKKTSKKEEKTATKKPVKKVEEPEEEDSDDDSEDGSTDEFSDMDRKELKNYIKENELDITVYKNTLDEELREKIRELIKNSKSEEGDEEESESEEEEEEEEETKPKSKVSLDDIRKKLAKK